MGNPDELTIADHLRDPDVQRHLAALPIDKRIAYLWRAKWLQTAHAHQIVPRGDWWSIWMMLAGRGAGKTRTAAETVGYWAWQEPETRWLVAAPTSADVQGTCFEGDSGLLSVIPGTLIKQYIKQPRPTITLTNGSMLIGIPASEPERFRGPQFHGAWLDELAAWEYIQDAWDQIQFGVRLGKRTRTVITTTPRPKDLIIELLGRDGDDVVVTTASTYANLDNLSDNFRKQILQYEGTKLGRQEIYAEIIDPEESGIVKRDMFRLWPADKPFPRFEYIVQSYDCATSEKVANDPTACITWGVFKPLDGPMSVMLIDCWQDRLQYPDLRPRVIEEYETIFGDDKNRKRVDLILVEDKSAGISLIQDLQRAHLPVRAYNPGKADKMQRLNIVSNIIAAGRVWIPESTQRKGYVRDWAEGFVSQICAFPETTHDDFVDACLVGDALVTMADGTDKRLDAVRIGDWVATPNGPRRVTATHYNGMKEVWDVNGLLATADHKIMTQDGWTRVDCLRQGIHNLTLYKEGQRWDSNQKAPWWKRWFLTGADITDTQKAPTPRTGATLLGRAQDFIGMCGNFIAVQFQKVRISTTLTATQATTTSQTLPASTQQNTARSIDQNRLSETSRLASSRTLIASEARPLNGTEAPRGLNGTSNTLNDRSQKLGSPHGFMRKALSFVSGVANKLCEKAHAGFIAVPRAKPQSPSSALVSRVINTHTMRQVFDLTVEGEHCYYANGILVHNCTQALRYLRDAGWLEIDPPPRDDWDDDDYADSGYKRRENPYAI